MKKRWSILTLILCMAVVTAGCKKVPKDGGSAGRTSNVNTTNSEEN